MAALVAHREKDEKLAQTIVTSLLEYSTQSEEKGIYWQGSAMRGYSPISMQVAMMEALHEIGCTTEQMDGMKTWLLGQKRLQSWDDEVSSMDAAYAIMLTGSDWFSEDNPVKVRPRQDQDLLHPLRQRDVLPRLGHPSVDRPDQAGRSYHRHRWQHDPIHYVS